MARKDETQASAEFGRRQGDAQARATMNEGAETAQRQSERLQSIMGASTRALQGVTDTSRGDVDAMMQSSARLARGLQEMGWEVMHFTQESIRRGLRAANDMMECRSVEDYVGVQREFMRETVEELMNESAKLLNLSSRAAFDAVDPLNSRTAEREGDEDEGGEPADVTNLGRAPGRGARRESGRRT